ncbi:MAG: hypothetical protein AB8G96_13545 [Phycisphaerales bacterium]
MINSEIHPHRHPRAMLVGLRCLAAAVIGIATPAHGQATPPPTEPVRVSPGDGDLGPTSEVQWVDQRVNSIGSNDFSSLYRVEDGFMRSLGALRAVFPRSIYVSPGGGPSVPIIPYDTIFMIGDPDGGAITPIVPRPGMIANRRISGDPRAASRPVGPGAATADPLLDPGRSLIAADDRQRPSEAALANARRVRELAAAGTIAGPDLQGFRDAWNAEAEAAAAPNARAETVLPRPERPTRPAIEMPAIVSDPAYRSARLASILRRALADVDAAAPPATTDSTTGSTSPSATPAASPADRLESADG